MRSFNGFAKYLSRGSHTSQQAARIIQLGPKTKEVGVDIGILSNLNVNDSDQKIRDEFWKVGYGLFRNAIDRDLVLKARDTILATVQSNMIYSQMLTMVFLNHTFNSIISHF